MSSTADTSQPTADDRAMFGLETYLKLAPPEDVEEIWGAFVRREDPYHIWGRNDE